PEEDLEEEPFKEEEGEILPPINSPQARLYIDLPSEVEEDEVTQIRVMVEPQLALGHRRMVQCTSDTQEHELVKVVHGLETIEQS
nr:hypothetical protein [Tanacetum cinerariifolium]